MQSIDLDIILPFLHVTLSWKTRTKNNKKTTRKQQENNNNNNNNTSNNNNTNSNSNSNNNNNNNKQRPFAGGPCWVPLPPVMYIDSSTPCFLFYRWGGPSRSLLEVRGALWVALPAQICSSEAAS